MTAQNLRPIIIISGPAGVGKTTIAKALQRRHKNLKASATYTTRSERRQAKEDKKVYFISLSEFKKMIGQNAFMEYAKVHENYYGTHRELTIRILKKYPVIFNIDVQGARQIQELYPKNTISIFLLPESANQMIRQMRARGKIEDADLINRLKSAKKEIAGSKIFDYRITNAEGKIKNTLAIIERILQPFLSKKAKSARKTGKNSAQVDKIKKIR